MRRKSTATIIVLVAGVCGAFAQDHCATAVIDYSPAPGQFVNDNDFNDPARALGWPAGGDPNVPQNYSLVTLGGFGGTLTLAFDHTVFDDPANPFGLDAVVFGNSVWVQGNPNRKWGECGVIEISRDANGNGAADDPWYLIPGTHIAATPDQHEIHTWDDNILDPNHPPFWPPADETWIPPGMSGVWTTAGYRLPADVFETLIMENPNGPDATEEAVYGYADFSPTLHLPGGQTPDAFYTRPDNPFEVGLTAGCGGGDAFDIAWAVDPDTWQPANLDGFDFIRITTGVDVVFIEPPFGEKSTEIDAVVDVAEGQFGDAENDGDVDVADFVMFAGCLLGPDEPIPPSPCRVMDFNQDCDLDLRDVAEFQVAFTGS